MRSFTLCFFVVAFFASTVHALAPDARDRRKIDAFDLSGHMAATVGAGFELSEDVRSIGHGHGMILLGLSKIARETHDVRAAVQGVAGDVGLQSSRNIRRFAATLSAAALCASAAEVHEDSFPLGGHHGAVFLAMHDLNDLLVESGAVRGFLRGLLENPILKLLLLGGAVVSACIEVWTGEKKKIGGHHGVAILAIMKTIKCLQLLREAWDEKKNR